MKHLVFIFLSLCLSTTCQEKTKQPVKDVAEKTVSFELSCEQQEDSLAFSHLPLAHYYKLYLTSPVFKEAIFIDTLLTCTKLDTSAYKHYDVPATIEKVVVSYYAGGGPMYYSYFEKPNKIVIMRGFQEEGGAYTEEMSPEELKKMEEALKFKEYKVITFNKDGSYDMVTIPEPQEAEAQK